MKKILILVPLLIFLLCNQAKSDNVIIKGNKFWTIFFSPFDNYPGIDKLRERLRDYSTNCTEDNCSFLSTWKIVHDRLMLVKIQNCQCNTKNQTANLKRLFGNRVKNGMMPAYWFTGEIWVTNTKPNSWGGMFATSWPSETRLIVDKGVVTSIKDFVYPIPVKTIYFKNSDSLNNFIYTHLDWTKFRNLPQTSRRSYFLFDQDAKGYMTNVTYDKNGNNAQTFDKDEMDEINRVLGLVQWPVFYYHGQPVKVFRGIDVVISKEVRDKYTKQN